MAFNIDSSVHLLEENVAVMSQEERRKPSVLYIGYESVQTRLTAIAEAGCKVECVSTMSEAVWHLRKAHFDALVIGPMVTMADRAVLVSEGRRRLPQLAVLFLYQDTIRGGHLADVCVCVASQPHAAVETLKNLLFGKRTHLRRGTAESN